MKVISRYFLFVLALSSSLLASDIDSLLLRGKSFYSVDVSFDSLENLAQMQHADGSWDGPVYNKAGHTPIEHLENVKTLAQGFFRFCKSDSSSDIRLCKKVNDAVFKALLFWFSHKNEFVSDNWWMNEIGIQRQLIPVCFLMWNDLPKAMQKLILEYFPREPSGNGTNRGWISELVVVRGIFETDESLIELGLKNLENTMVLTLREGHQPDHSFFMHGNQLYNGGYGKSALSLAARWASLTRGTVFAFPEDVLQNMSSLALEGNRWMMWKGMVDVMTMGREISLKTDNKDAKDFLPVIQNLAFADSLRHDEYNQWRRDIAGEESQKGCRYFWRGEMLVCKSDIFYGSVKMSSSRTVGSEFLNRENRKGFWLGSGVLSLYIHPDDYRDIYPLWEWNLLPGITSYGESDLKEKRVTNLSDVVGGLAVGNYGVASMELDRTQLHGKKSWFFLGDEVVALGTDISSSHVSNVTTTLDQRWVHSNVLVDGNFLKNRQDSARSLWHDRISYEMLDNQQMVVSIDDRSGKWSDIGTQKIEESGRILSLWINHGIKPSKSDYAYLIRMNVDSSDYLKNSKPQVQILKNDADGQIVFDDKKKVLAGTLFRPGLAKETNLSIRFNRPVIFLFFREQKDCSLKIFNLERDSRNISVDIKIAQTNGSWKKKNAVLKFPNSDYENPQKTMSVSCPVGF